MITNANTSPAFVDALRDLPIRDEFKTMILMMARGAVQFSVIHGHQSDNVDILKDMSITLAEGLEGLVWAAGGDASYVQPWRDDMPNDIDIAFFGKNVSPVFQPRSGMPMGYKNWPVRS